MAYEPSLEPRSWLFTRYMDRFGLTILDRHSDSLSIDVETVFAEIMLSDLIDDDSAYEADIKEAHAMFRADGRPEGTDPDLWRAKLRLAELRALWKAAVRHGVLAKVPLTLVDGEL